MKTLIGVTVAFVAFLLILVGSVPAEDRPEQSRPVFQEKGTVQSVQPMASPAGPPVAQGIIQGGQQMLMPQSGQFQAGQQMPMPQMSQMGGCGMMGGGMGGGMMGGGMGRGMMGGGMQMDQSGMSDLMTQGMTMKDIVQIISMQDMLQIMMDMTRIQEKMANASSSREKEVLRKELEEVREKTKKLMSELRGMITGQMQQ